MFGSKEKKDNSSKKIAATSSTAQYGNSINSLGAGTKMEGDLSAQNDIRIDGELIGTLKCKGKVILGPKGKIDGTVNCTNAVFEGSFSGILNVSEILHIKASAQISGEVKTGKLNVDNGAVFNVACAMGSSGTNKAYDKSRERTGSKMNSKKQGSLVLGTS